MIIRNDKRGNRGARLLLGLLIAAALAGLLFFTMYRKAPPPPGEAPPLLQCSAEDSVGVLLPGEAKPRLFFVTGADTFMNGETFSLAAARRGLSSSLVKEGQPYGLGYQFRGLTGGEAYRVTIWRNSHQGQGDFVVDAEWGLYKAAEPTGRVEGKWEEFEVAFEVPYQVNEGRAKVYAYNPGAAYVYYDDLAIFKTRGTPREERGNLPLDSIRTINLVIEPQHYALLERKRDEALRIGVLKTEDGDFVPARIEENGALLDAKLRLKGDWTDHLLDDKWSFRIRLEDGLSWNRLTTFSLQSPYTRSFLLEYIFHRILAREGLLAPRYDFIHLKINGESRGAYAWEEHFEKQIPEYNQRREGPIMKFVEDGFWDVNERWDGDAYTDLDERIPIYPAAVTEPFHRSHYLGDSGLAAQVEIAQDLMNAYKHGERTVWEVFDADKVARYYALVDLLKAHHAFIWHNQRLYYNPVLAKLEPIGYDGYTESGPLVWIKKPFIGYGRNFRYMEPAYKGLMFERFFHDYAFVARYVHYLDEYSQEGFIDAFMAEMEPDIALREVLFQKEWPGYSFDRSFIREEAKKIRMAIFPLPHTSVKAYRAGAMGGGMAYQVFNYHCLPVRLLGVGKKADNLHPFRRDSLLPSYANNFPPEMATLVAEEDGKFIFFEVPGIDSIFQAEVLPWEAPGGPTPEQELFSGLQIKSNELYAVDEAKKEVRFKAGRYQTAEHILVPPGYTVEFEAGVDLDLVKGAMFISKSRVMARGSEERPVHIHSSDKSAGGFTLLQVPDGDKSEFFYCVFEGLRALDYKGWSLTGAVTAYESEVFFLHCRFLHNNSEDAVNLVRSVFNMTRCYVGYAASDGLDADFCTGTVDRCTFYHTVNDGMDISGTEFYVTDARVEHAGDKALSVGEESHAVVKGLDIRDCNIGIASKDLSVAEIEDVDLKDLKQGFVLYQKKPEYGPASMFVKKYTSSSVSQLYQVQEGSNFELEGRRIEGKW